MKRFSTLKSLGKRGKNKIYRKGHQYMNLLRRKMFTKYIKCDVRELFFQENSEKFNRYDIIVRYLALENYYGQNDFGFDLYKRMQGNRINNEWIDQSVIRFKKLITSYEKNKYDKSSEIEIDENLHLIDGSHRMALALYHKIYTISCKVIPYPCKVHYGIEWFIENGFTIEEINLLKKKYSEIHNYIIEPFICTLWPPVQNYFDEITEKLGMVGNVIGYKDFEYDESTFYAIVKSIYSIDDIENWKIEKKIEKMNLTSQKKIRFVMLNIESPQFRLKNTNNNTLSIACERIKKMIRNAYKDKVDNYFHDIIMHIGDNYQQNIFIRNLYNLSIDVKGILATIQSYDYAISKIEVPYMPKDFPENYPLNKDIDILCSQQDYPLIVNAIGDYVEKYKDEITIRKIKKYINKNTEYRTLIRLELENYLILQFDISYLMDDTTDDFITGVIQNRVKKELYYETSSEYEYMIRLHEVFEYPEKKHHIEYLKKYSKSINKELCEKYLKFNWKNII